VCVAHVVVQIVGLGRAPPFEQQLEHLAPERCEQGPTVVTELLGFGEPAGNQGALRARERRLGRAFRRCGAGGRGGGGGGGGGGG
jgi:hypothetical protein